MNTPRTKGGQFAKVNPADAVLDAACAEVIARCQSYLRTDCSPVLANTITLQLATTEAAMLDDGGAA